MTASRRPSTNSKPGAGGGRGCGSPSALLPGPRGNVGIDLVPHNQHEVLPAPIGQAGKDGAGPGAARLNQRRILPIGLAQARYRSATVAAAPATCRAPAAWLGQCCGWPMLVEARWEVGRRTHERRGVRCWQAVGGRKTAAAAGGSHAAAVLQRHALQAGPKAGRGYRGGKGRTHAGDRDWRHRHGLDGQ